MSRDDKEEKIPEVSQRELRAKWLDNLNFK
jgi:hypothetical protein